MSMTHYMELLAVNQPWNLFMFMAAPVILAETIAITELYLLFTRNLHGRVRLLNRGASILVGVAFVAIIVYLVPMVVVPLTQTGGWRGPIDVVAVVAYILSGLPMIGIALQDLSLVHRGESDEKRLAWHAAGVAAFLILAHVAMIAGMLDPTLLTEAHPQHQQHNM